MYQSFKKIAFQLIPRRVLLRLEPWLRRIVAWAYRGSTFECNICMAQLRAFVALPSGDALCPNCGSLPRHRRLWAWLGEANLPLNIRVLDFSPARAFSQTVKRTTSWHYETSGYDAHEDFSPDHRYDLTNLPLPDHCFDLLIAYHVLEHIEQDTAAMREMYRILSPNGGFALIQTPFKAGEIYENPSVQTPEARLEHFGQADHVRVYSVEGLQRRLENVGFNVQILHFSATDQAQSRWGLKADETILLAHTA